MILPAILYTFKGKLLLGVWAIFATIAVTEAFFGQLMIAVVVALIGATPPTVAIIIMTRKQSEERAAANKVLLEGQQEVVKAVDGQLAKYVAVKEQVGNLTGREEERVEARARLGEEAIAAQNAGPAQVIVKNPEDDPANVKHTQ